MTFQLRVESSRPARQARRTTRPEPPFTLDGKNTVNCAAKNPDLVAYEPDGKPYTVKYQYLTTMLLNEVQKQYHRAEAEAEVIKSQEQRISELEQRLSRLEGVVETSLRISESKTAYAPEGSLSQPLRAFRH